MICYFHPETTIVATCQDCSKGLCKNCSDKFNIQICVSCNRNRGATEKSTIMKELKWMIGFPIIAMFFNLGLISKHAPSIGGFSYIFIFYMLIAIVSGWYKLNKLTASYFLFLPLIGWVIYFVIKLVLSLYVGVFIAPFRIYKNINRLKEINQIETIN